MRMYPEDRTGLIPEARSENSTGSLENQVL